MASTQKRISRARKVQRKPPEEKGEDQVSKEERIERSLERDGYAVTVREAKLDYTAFRLAYDANGDVNNPAERWKLGDEFIAEHKGDDEEDAFKTPPRPTSSDPKEMGLFPQFYVTMETLRGDAEQTYTRLMTEQFGSRPEEESAEE